MRGSTERILTTHVGALPAPAGLWANKNVPDAELQQAVSGVVAKQREVGLDFVNEGEFTKGGNWVEFVNSRLSGFEPPAGAEETLFGSRTGKNSATSTRQRWRARCSSSAPNQTRTMDWHCTGKVEYVGQAELARQLSCLRGALGSIPASDAFLTSTAPSSIEPGRENTYYKNLEVVFALADAIGRIK
jgi:5-methyltetrahydropteroyltriglutamate--homocysteine methyltransferase